MKLARFETAAGRTTWGVVQAEGVVDVPALAAMAGAQAPTGIKDLLGTGRSTWLADLLGSPPAEAGDALHRLEDVRLRAPLPDAGKILAVGRNYLDHVSEADIVLPARPKIFTKFDSTVVGHEDDIVHPTSTEQLDYEVEVAVVIGTTARHVPIEAAMDHVAGYTVTNDISARDIQFADEQLTLGKNFETFCPMGPVVTTIDEMPDPDAIRLSLSLNGEVMQDSTTEHLIFSIPYIVSFLSYVLTLNPGDVIMTGTPSGVGCFREPPVWLRPGDVIETTVEGVGTLVNRVVAGTAQEPAPPTRP